MNEVAEQIEDYLPALKRYALSLARNPAAADDLVQECAMRALSKARLYKPGTNLRAWLFTILHNLYISEGRRSGKWKQPHDPEAAMAKLSAPAPQPATVMLKSVSKAMTALPRQQRRVLFAVGVEGKSYEEVSAEMDIPVGTVKSRCFRARETLVTKLESTQPQPGGLPAAA